jgi:hypothetical protein
MQAQGESPGASQHALLAEAIITGMKGASEVEREKKDKYAAHEKLKILAACRLHPDDWDQIPPIYHGKIAMRRRTIRSRRAISDGTRIPRDHPDFGVPIYTAGIGCQRDIIWVTGEPRILEFPQGDLALCCAPHPD